MANSVKKSAGWKILLPFFFVLLLLGMGLTYLVGDISATSSLLIVTIFGLVASFVMTYAVNRLSRPLISPTMISASFTFQLSVLVAYLMAGGSPIVSGTIYHPNMTASPFYVVLPLLILPAISLAVMVFAYPFLRKISNQSTLFMDLRDPAETQKLMYYLSVAAALMVLSLPAVVYFGLLGYFIRILWAALAMTPLLAGWLSSKNQRVNRIWIVALGVAMLMALVTGGRGVAFRSIGYFMGGRIIGSTQRLRTREVLRIGGVGILVLILFGFIGNLRDQIGRVGVNEVSRERVVSVFESSEENLSADDSDVEGQGTTVHHGLRRLIVAANLAVPLLTERGIPLRSSDGLWEEAISYVDISLLSGSSKRSRLEQGLGSAAATRYGFNVSTQTSVPFPVIADGWSRGGLLGAILFGLFVCVVIIGVECLLIYITSHTPARRAILLCAIAIVAFFNINSQPAFSTLRGLLLFLPFTWISLVCLDLFRRLIMTHRSQRSGPRSIHSRSLKQ